MISEMRSQAVKAMAEAEPAPRRTIVAAALPENQPRASLPLVDVTFVEADIPPDVARTIEELLLPGEAIFVLLRLSSTYSFRLASGKEEKACFWTIVTGARLFLFALASDG